MHIEPTSFIGLAVLAIFCFGMLLIILEAKLHIDKFKPALFMLTSFLLIGLYYWMSGDDPQRFEHFVEMQKENKVELFSLIAFMAFMWMIVEILAERGVFSTLNSYLIAKGLRLDADVLGHRRAGRAAVAVHQQHHHRDDLRQVHQGDLAQPAIHPYRACAT